MSESWSIPPTWTLPSALAAPRQREIECLPAEPLSESQLAALLGAEPVSEVWLPVSQRRSRRSASDASPWAIRDVWIEFSDRLHAIRYECPGGGCPLAWYRALRPIERDTNGAVIEASLAQYSRLSERPAVSE